MPIYRLHPEHVGFPPRSEFDSDMVAVGGDLQPKRLLEAYARGVFPWYNEPGKLHWYCPEERCVLRPSAVEISHSMRGLLRKVAFTYTMDKAFDRVIEACRGGERQGRTWIHDEIVEAYTELHVLGCAHSLEVWQGDELVGGLYGVSLGNLFFGESMFSKQANASKAALIHLCQFLAGEGVELVDCQVPNDHLLSMGAEVWHRDDFLDILEESLENESIVGNWQERFANWCTTSTNNNL
jgi:leucyl/phenylalanyl-tRNA--protein transferase